jgi:hypothetical protein
LAKEEEEEEKEEEEGGGAEGGGEVGGGGAGGGGGEAGGGGGGGPLDVMPCQLVNSSQLFGKYLVFTQQQSIIFQKGQICGNTNVSTQISHCIALWGGHSNLFTGSHIC